MEISLAAQAVPPLLEMAPGREKVGYSTLVDLRWFAVGL